MKFEPLTHRSPEWYEKRLGKPTASQFHRIITPKKLELSSSADDYMAELIGERIFQRSMQRDISHYEAVQYGIENEDRAAADLQAATLAHVELQPGGLMTDDAERYGASPDRQFMTGNSMELVEIKCLQIPQQIATLLWGMDDKYRIQVQGQLLVSGYQRAHFYSWRHDCPAHYEVVERDEKLIAALQRLLDQFCRKLDAEEKRARDLGSYG